MSSPSRLQIQTFTPQDKAEVVALWTACGLTRPWNDPSKDIDRKHAMGDGLFLLGKQGDRLAASIMGGYDGHRGWIYYLGVAPDAQKLGIGRQMVAAIEEKLVGLGCPKVNLQMRQDAAEAAQFYAALGYTPDAVVSFGKRLIPD